MRTSKQKDRGSHTYERMRAVLLSQPEWKIRRWPQQLPILQYLSDGEFNHRRVSPPSSGVKCRPLFIGDQPNGVERSYPFIAHSTRDRDRPQLIRRETCNSLLLQFANRRRQRRSVERQIHTSGHLVIQHEILLTQYVVKASRRRFDINRFRLDTNRLGHRPHRQLRARSHNGYDVRQQTSNETQKNRNMLITDDLFVTRRAALTALS